MYYLGVNKDLGECGFVSGLGKNFEDNGSKCIFLVKKYSFFGKMKKIKSIFRKYIGGVFFRSISEGAEGGLEMERKKAPPVPIFFGWYGGNFFANFCSKLGKKYVDILRKLGQKWIKIGCPQKWSGKVTQPCGWWLFPLHFWGQPIFIFSFDLIDRAEGPTGKF